MLRASAELAATALFVLAVLGWTYSLTHHDCATTTKRADRLAVSTEVRP